MLHLSVDVDVCASGPDLGVCMVVRGIKDARVKRINGIASD